MTGVEGSVSQQQTSSASFRHAIAFDNSFDSQLEQVEYSSSFDEAEWDPVGFDLTKSSHPKWKQRNKNKPSSPPKPRRIQDIRLTRLDSDSGGDSEEETTTAAAAAADADKDDDNWPYEILVEPPGSPCALFGNPTIMSSSPAEGFEGEFTAGGDPEWDSHSKRSTGSRDNTTKSRNNRRAASSRRLLQAQQQQQQQPEEDDDESDGSYVLETASQSASEEEEEDYSDESDHSVTDSPTYEDEGLMVTPAMGKTREMQRKKPPTLKRGAHQVQTPSIVKAMKDKHALTVSDDDDEDNESIDFDFDSDLESGGSAHSRKGSRENGSSSNSRSRRFDAASNASFRRASMSKKNFKFDRSMSSADLKAARKANNSFKKGHSDMNKSFSALSESKRRMHRSNSRRAQEKMQNSFSNSSGAGLHGSSRRLSAPREGKSPPPNSTRKTPSRAKSMGNPTTGTSKLKAGLAKLGGGGGGGSTTDEPPSATGGKKSYGATLSALKVLSGADGGGGGESKGGGQSDLKSAIMQQVYRSTSMNPIELKPKPKPKMTKANSLRAAAASGEIFPAKDKETKDPKQGRVRRSKTATERSASISDFGASYHESIAKMRKQKMADASEKSGGSTRSKETDAKAAAKDKDRNVGRAKSFSHANNRSGTKLDMEDAEAAEVSPVRSAGNRPRMKRGSSKRLQTAQDGDGELDGLGSGHSKRSLQKSGSSRRLQQSSPRMYDASPQKPSGTSVIALLSEREPVTDSQMMQKGNRQMFHALMYRTRMGIDMEQLRQTVEGGDDDDGSASAADDSRREYAERA